jgi:hypothetical protein
LSATGAVINVRRSTHEVGTGTEVALVLLPGPAAVPPSPKQRVSLPAWGEPTQRQQENQWQEDHAAARGHVDDPRDRESEQEQPHESVPLALREAAEEHQPDQGDGQADPPVAKQDRQDDPDDDQDAAEAGVGIVPGSLFYSDGRGGDNVRLSFSQVDESLIDEGIERLASLLPV